MAYSFPKVLAMLDQLIDMLIGMAGKRSALAGTLRAIRKSGR